MTTTTEVPGRFDVGINGLAFLVDDREGRGVHRRSVPFLRNQADIGDQAGAQSLSPAGVWRRSQEDWSHGAGQSDRDRENSDPARFRSSKGVYVWDRWKMSLLPAATSVYPLPAIGANDGVLVVAEGYAYVIDGAEVFRSVDLVTWSNAAIFAGEAVGTVYDLTTDGYRLYAALGVNGVHRTTFVGPTTHYSDLDARVIGYANGRLMAGNGPSLYNITAAGAPPAPLYTHAATSWSWTSFAEGPEHIYAAGGDKLGFSQIFKVPIQPDGTALAAPSLAAPTLPPGELVLSMLGYAGHVVVGTNKGVRLAAIGAGGNLTLGSPIPAANCAALVGRDRFVYFAWNSYETNLHGIGRFDLSTFTAPLTPAYASDLMGGDGASVRGISVLKNRVVFGIGGRAGVPGAVWAESPTTKVVSGTLDTGEMSFGIADDKVATHLDIAHEPLVGSHGASLSANGGAFASLGTHTEGGGEGAFVIAETKAERYEIRHMLSRDTAGTAGPTITRSTLSVYPTPRRPSEVFIVWVSLFERDVVLNGYIAARDPRADLDAIIALEEAGTVIDFQLGVQTYRALIEDHHFVSENQLGGKWWNGSVELTVRTV